MRDTGPKSGPERSRAGREDRNLIEFDSRTIQKSGYSRTLPLPKQGLSNLDLDSGDEVVPMIDPERGELVLRPRGDD
jgi:hypothetical protein